MFGHEAILSEQTLLEAFPRDGEKVNFFIDHRSVKTRSFRDSPFFNGFLVTPFCFV